MFRLSHYLHELREPAPLGTAGAVKNAQSLRTGDRTLVLRGDERAQ